MSDAALRTIQRAPPRDALDPATGVDELTDSVAKAATVAVDPSSVTESISPVVKATTVAVDIHFAIVLRNH
eukprot:COSAG06_NODE_1393_length_9596_cov_47.877014_5_plen_71_part_00